MSINDINVATKKIEKREHIFNFLGKKSCRIDKGTDQVNPLNGNFLAWSLKNCNFKLKKNKNRSVIDSIGKVRSGVNFYSDKNKHLEKAYTAHTTVHTIVHNKAYNKAYAPLLKGASTSGTSGNLTPPEYSEIQKAPHNTSQYLIENYREGRKEKFRHVQPLMLLYNQEDELYNYTNSNSNSNEFYNSDIDDICLIGGTMKGILNSKAKLGFDKLPELQGLGDFVEEALINNSDNKDKDRISIMSTELSNTGEKAEEEEYIQDAIAEEFTNDARERELNDKDTNDSNSEELNELKELVKQNENKIKELQMNLIQKAKQKCSSANAKDLEGETGLDYPRYEYS